MEFTDSLQLSLYSPEYYVIPKKIIIHKIDVSNSLAGDPLVDCVGREWRDQILRIRYSTEGWY